MSGKRNGSVCRGHELANALYIIYLIPCQALQGYLGVKVDKNSYTPDLIYADDIVLSSNTIDASKKKVLSALIPGEQRRPALLDGASGPWSDAGNI